MAHHLDGKLPLTTLDVRYSSGSAWVCRSAEASSCGADFIGGKSTAPPGIALSPTPDGTFAVGALHASTPAARPSEIGDLSHSDGALRFQGSQAYESKDFALCARLFGQVTKPTQSDAWNTASCLALAGKADQAFVQIAAARALGAKVAEMRADEDFVSLKADPRWDRL